MQKQYHQIQRISNKNIENKLKKNMKKVKNKYKIKLNKQKILK